MGNEISHKRYCCRKSRKFKRLATVQENTGADHPIAQTAPGAVLWSTVNPPPKEKSQDTATGMQNKDVGKASDIAPSSMPEAQEMAGTTELQELGEAQPSAEQSEEPGNKPTAMSPDRKTHALTRARSAAAQQAHGDTGVTSDLPLQTAGETGTRAAEDVVTEQARGESDAGVRKGPRKKMCKVSPLCRWLKKLKSPAGNANAKPDAITGQE